MGTRDGLYWTVLNTRGRRWEPQEGWETRDQAERSAKFYRRDRHRRCVVVRGAPNDPKFADRLMAAVLA